MRSLGLDGLLCEIRQWVSTGLTGNSSDFTKGSRLTSRGQGRGAKLGGAEDSTKEDAESTGRGEGIGLGGGVGVGLGGGLAHSASAEGVGEEDGPGGRH